MTAKHLNLQASIKARLLNISREKKVDFNRILSNYALERLLYRLSVSKYNDEFVLKGAMLFSCWSDDSHRATRDIDFLKSGEISIVYLTKVFTKLCEQQTATDDGMEYLTASIRVGEIREDNAYGGIRIRIKSTLGNIHVPVQADVGIGDIITPASESIEFPVLLDMPIPKLKAYPVETVIAEKFEAMVHLGLANSRLKDFYDIWTILNFIPYDAGILSKAIHNTFSRRGTALPSGVPLALTDEFSADAGKQKQWKAFVQKAGVQKSANVTLQETVDEIRPLLMKALKNRLSV
ncbi:MAG: nucleotidyl transferase AbiEii/AbiGii toxin family protein [Mariprofundaceae bacterium]|nr:nucleotidyl transferase AbiEii/AbiGii toxin family protein [Mariprofundaceae bacterium]